MPCKTSNHKLLTPEYPAELTLHRRSAVTRWMLRVILAPISTIKRCTCKFWHLEGMIRLLHSIVVDTPCGAYTNSAEVSLKQLTTKAPGFSTYKALFQPLFSCGLHFRAAATGVGQKPVKGCRCPRCLPLFKPGKEAEAHKVRSRALLEQSRQEQPAKARKPGQTDIQPPKAGKPVGSKSVPLSAQATKRGRKETMQVEPLQTAQPKRRRKAATAEAKVQPEAEAPAKAHMPRKKTSSAVKEIKAWLLGIKRRYQQPTSAGKAWSSEAARAARERQAKKRSQALGERLPANTGVKASWPTFAATPLPPQASHQPPACSHLMA